MSAYAIGIDLGTTNCALASAPSSAEHPAPTPLEVPQVIRPGEVQGKPLLPSFVYLPSAVEFPAGSLGLPWDAQSTSAVGTFAREHGAKVPGRLVSSAKSWLSYAGVDRRAPILPWEAPDEVAQRSPLRVSADYLSHLRAAWDAAHPDAPLHRQDVVLTVPASFDAVARELTAEAAQRAGLGDGLRLLEEPQAALYAWLADRGPKWRDDVSVGDVILVCDIGGGTTDFSLIEVREEGGVLHLERVAVGDHILLGGDNMDLALAWAVRQRLEAEGKRIDDWQMRGLWHGCRAAKEALLDDPELESYPLAIVKRGSQLIGGTIRTALGREELERTLLEGFFPVVDAAARPHAPRRAGLTTLGLPYASDAGVTRHLAAFLGRDSLPRPEGRALVHPTALLFNGGVTRSAVVRERLESIVGAWTTAEGGAAPKVLEGVHPDLAVCRGAAYYAHARLTGGVRIRGGTARAYYVGVEHAGLAVPGMPPQLDAVCIAPFGMEEGAEVELSAPFGLVVGEPTSFRFFCSSERRGDQVGAVVSPAQITELVPIETALEAESGDVGRVVTVRLHARVTEVGTLELSAVAESGPRWKLSFDVRVE